MEEANGALFITLELVEGETLATRIGRERLSIPGLLRITSAVVDAVACAHEHGILHRDLKPANIMLTADDQVKVLDFGLAKLREAPSAAEAPTLRCAGPLSRPDLVLGTPSYMSPEQAEQAAIDERSDIFSLGVILYELATGERPFNGTSAMSIISSVLRDTPRPITDLNALAPPALSDIVCR